MLEPWIDRAAPVRRGEELDLERLHSYLGEALPELAGELRVEQFPGGFSNLTYLLHLGDRQLVLRRPPFGANIKSAHDMGREHRILSRLVDVYPKVPRPLTYCTDEAVLGAPFYVMERVEGAILRPRAQPGEAPAPEHMATAARALVNALVELHLLDVEAAGLRELGRPEGYVERQIGGWSKRYSKARTDDIPEMERAAAWLAEHMPRESGAALVHNDFKYDNLIFNPDDWSQIRAILDWEMATLGDPLMDLGTSISYWVDAEDPPMLQELQLSPTTLPGNPRRSEVVDLYAAASGKDVGDIVFYYVYGLFKLGVIVQQIYTRYKLGHTRDPRFAGLIESVKLCGRTAAQAIERKRIDQLFD